MANGKPNPYLCHLDQQQNFNGFVKLLEDAVENQSKKDVEPKKRDANKVLKFKKLDNKNKITPDVRFQDISNIIAELENEVAILEQQVDDVWHKEYMGEVREYSVEEFKNHKLKGSLIYKRRDVEKWNRLLRLKVWYNNLK